tara:strand:- start:1474 stop:1845 length:372 start_codon:yes stop_codon:yes gene_type:complete
MSDLLWMSGMGQGLHGRSAAGSVRSASADNQALESRENIRELRHQVERLSLLNQALWELIRDKAGLTDADLERMAKEIDLRDGTEDGKMGGGAVTCPTCLRVSNAKHYKCLYCGELFAKPAFG